MLRFVSQVSVAYTRASFTGGNRGEIKPNTQLMPVMTRLLRYYNRETFAELFKIAAPMMVSQGAFAVMIFTDRLFMAQIDPTHMAAALGGGVALFFSICFFSGLFGYANALTAQYLGARELHKCSKVVTQGLLMVVASIPFLACIAFFVADVFVRMGHESAFAELEKTYYLWLMWGAPITLAKVVFSSYFAGIGRTRLVMICDVCGLLLNVPLCYAMVFGHLGFPALGIIGAALSTIVATLFALLLFVGCYLAKEHRRVYHVAESLVFHAGIMKRFVRLGLPAGTELILNVAAFNLFLLMFQGYGITEAAAAAIVFNWDILCFVPMVGLNIGVVSLIGRFVGARDMQRTSEVIFAAFVMALTYSGSIAIIYSVFRFPLVGVFAPPEGDFSAILSLAGFMMIGLSSYVMADATIQVAGGVLRGAGDTQWLMYASTSTHWVALCAQFYLIRVAEWGPRASWIAFVAMLFSIAILFAWRLWDGRWKEEERLLAVMAE